MKKALALFLALIMCQSLVACGGNEAPKQTEASAAAAAPAEVPAMTKEKMLAAAESVSMTDINNAALENIVRAKADYCGKTMLVKGTVMEIKEDHIQLTASSSSMDIVLDVYLPLEEIVNLQRTQYVEVVGITTDEIEETTQTFSGYDFTSQHFKMPSAYFVNDRVEVSGKLFGANQSYAPAWNFLFPNSNVAKLVYFSEDQDTSALTYENSQAPITFNAKYVNDKYVDAIIISIG